MAVAVNARLIDFVPAPVNVRNVDLDETLGPRPDDALTALLREDLDRLSVTELEARATALEHEIARTRRKIDGAVTHRASAEALFRR
ncbi:DUF1192 domain-containing protein [Sphingomonas sp.]|jgi:uncharacterized small protein (DUF1192 family)|uniref:DUF1192 domain-containing protein n=1 Tax=Sphingomonas sp. TaxID=28214 RepID=UPI0035C7C24E